MDDKVLKLRSILKTMPLNDNQINNILGIIDTQNKEIDDTIAPLLEQYYSYGIEKDFRINTSEAIRVGNLDLHRSLPIQSKMRGCLLDDDGNIVEYLPENDWTTATRDGSKGQVMVHIPHHYRRFYTKDNDNIIGVRISELPFKGYHYVPDMFIGAYEAALDRINLKLSSVVNTTTNFRGGNNNSNWDNTYRNLLGRPITNLGRNVFQEYARNRGNTSWNICTYELRKTLVWLYVIEYANFNCQLKYNSELTSEGYHQGGLDNGVSNAFNIHSYNDSNPFIPCGYTDSLGNNSGIIKYTLYNEDGTIFSTQNVPRYRGVENIYGHIRELLEGINVIVSESNENNETKLNKVYVCNNPKNFSNTSVDNYTYIGDESTSSGYIKTLIFGDSGCILPFTVGADSSYHIGDQYTSPNLKDNILLKSIIVSGSMVTDLASGIFFADSYNGIVYHHITLGSRICFIPTTK